MNPKIRQLYDICTAALNKCQYTDSIIDEHFLFVAAKENGLIGLVYPVIAAILTDENIKTKFQKEHYAYIAADIKQKETANLINSLLNDKGIDHIYLKGIMLKKLYPESYMRAMGDIDIFIRENQRNDIEAIFAEAKIKIVGHAEHHDNYLYGKDIHIEVHHHLFPDRHPFVTIDPWTCTKSGDLHCFYFEKEYELVYLLSHLAKHFTSSGAGLRSLLDIGLYLQSNLNELNPDKTLGYLKEIALDGFFTHVIYLNHYCFNLELPEKFLFSKCLSSLDYKKLAQYVVKAGVHGYGQSFNVFAVQMATHQLKAHRILSFYIKKIFPPYRTMAKIYPVLAKGKILLPFCWIIRWFSLLFKKTTYRKIKKLNFSNKEVTDNINFIKRIGL